MARNVDIAIVGAGAAGLAAGIFSAETRPNIKIALLDGARSIGAKILVSGGGRCNLTNERVTPADFYANRRIVEKILRRFDEQATVGWFESLGVSLKREPQGKIFPVDNRARTVLQALLHRCNELGITLITQHRVTEITPTPTGFHVFHEGGPFSAQRVILATGGRSLPKSGSDGQGWAMTQKLGHTVTPTSPALVPLVLEDTFFHSALSGISHEATVTTRMGDVLVDRRTGSLLWTHFGVSGPVVLDASRFWSLAHDQGQPATMSLSFFPDKNFQEVDYWLSKASRLPGKKTVLALLSQYLPNRIAEGLCAYMGKIDPLLTKEHQPGSMTNDFGARPLNRLPRPQRRALTHALTDLPLPVRGTRGWNYAEVAAGGIPLQEVNPGSMASRKVPGMYLIGEMLDCDGRIGGFNFQWAWTTGHIAGCSAAHSVE